MYCNLYIYWDKKILYQSSFFYLGENFFCDFVQSGYYFEWKGEN